MGVVITIICNVSFLVLYLCIGSAGEQPIPKPVNSMSRKVLYTVIAGKSYTKWLSGFIRASTTLQGRLPIKPCLINL